MQAVAEPSPRPRPRPSPTPKPTMPRPTVAPTIAPTTVAASNCRSTIATAPTPSLLIANYSSMEDAYDNVQHGHATYECAEILIEELQQYDKAEPYLWCVLDHCAGCDVNGMCPTAYLSLETTSKCESAVWNYSGLREPQEGHARLRPRQNVLRQGPGAVARELRRDVLHDGLYLTLNNATAARATHADFCAACDGPSEDAVAALGRCPTPAPSDVVDAARRRGPTVLDGVLMVLSLAVVATCSRSWPASRRAAAATRSRSGGTSGSEPPAFCVNMNDVNLAPRGRSAPWRRRTRAARDRTRGGSRPGSRGRLP